MGQFRPWVIEFDRKSCDVGGLSLLSAQGAEGKSQMANLKDVDLEG